MDMSVLTTLPPSSVFDGSCSCAPKLISTDIDKNDDSNAHMDTASTSSHESEFSIDDCGRLASLPTTRETAKKPKPSSLALVPENAGFPSRRQLDIALDAYSQLFQGNSTIFITMSGDERRGGSLKTFLKDLKRSVLRSKSKAVRSPCAVQRSCRSKRHTTHDSRLLLERQEKEKTGAKAFLDTRKSWDSRNGYFRRLKFYVRTDERPGFSLTMSNVTGAHDTRSESGETRISIAAISSIDAWDAGLRPGDLLESVADTCVRGMSTKGAMTLARNCARGSVLRFSTPQDGSLCTPERFDVVLGHQKLGVAFVGDGAELIPVVHRILKQGGDNVNVSSSECHPNLHLGDVLVAVNGIDAIALGVDKAMALVASAPRPITLAIQRVSNETHFPQHDCEAKSISSSSSSDRHSQKILSRLHSRRLVRSIIDTELSSPEEVDIAFEFDDDKESIDLTKTVRASHSSCVDHSGDDILIVWKHGPLGLTLQEDDISGLPIVNRLTGKGTSTGIERVHHGYLLDSVNGVKTERESFAALCARLAKMEKPVLLAFKPPNEHGVYCEDAESYAFSATSSSRSSSCSSSSSRLSSDSFGDNQVSRHRATQQKSILDMCYAGKLRGKAPLGKNEYELRWHAGEELGLVLGKHPMQQLPYIRNIQSSSTLDFGGRNAVGDTLVAVNNLETHGLPWQEVRLLLQSATRPTMLRFRRHQCDSDDASSTSSTDSKSQMSKQSCPTSFNLLWATGHLGITFSSYVDSDNGDATVIVVKCVKQGHARQTGLVAIGDRLVAVNGKPVARNDESFHYTMDMLKTMSKPVVLGFQRPMIEVDDMLCGLEIADGFPWDAES
ncbi:hypothetical protein FI667_g12140, partial [Globisporangium splendens]